ncbi:TetR/AcrR family transcriptional regulator [Aquibacillus salsiterrae]|uniref:TetR/AcrR family transcriptional regulator n=1 Tax=Aquibacillus salsiterrae TaxID=2950439 RepID=A0A9X3WAQ8_9BACI|nr:TetR/AcrR family transcriptional regulator [Aquibacillus salsiterrae]MDC3415835.1 TetR/AcrR family transcriptional regulator [Aquibacillus salsiterrae]
MNSRKQQVIKKSQQLFIEKGYQATSIQDILDYSGISKGTFYNYFSSKNELLISIFKELAEILSDKRNEIMIGQDPADLDVFTKQIELSMKINKQHRIFTLFEEVLISNDPELKHFVKESQMKVVIWIYERLLEIFGEEKQPYLLDSAIMFVGILHQNMKYYITWHDKDASIHPVVQYSVKRMATIVEDLAHTREQLNQPSLVDKWFPNDQTDSNRLQEELKQLLTSLKKSLIAEDQRPYVELLDLIEEELLQAKHPRAFLIQTTVNSLNQAKSIDSSQLEHLKQLITNLLN